MAEVDVAVVGAGLAGIAAALELRQRGHQVLVLEAGDRLGGKVGALKTQHGSFPTGPSSFNGRHASLWRLVELLGLEKDAERVSAQTSSRFIVRNGALNEIRPSPLSLLTTRALSWSDRRAVVRELFARPFDVGADESLDAFLTRHFGRPMVEHVLSAMLTGVFAGDLRKLSARSCLSALVDAEREHGSVIRGALKSMRRPSSGPGGIFTFRQGMSQLGERAGQLLRPQLGSRVLSIAPTKHGLVLEVATRQGAQSVHARRVVLATEAQAAAQALRSLFPRASQLLSGFAYAPMALVHWVETSPGSSKLPRGFGFLAPAVENCFSLGTLFIGDLLDGPRRFSTFVGGALFPERMVLSDDALGAGVLGDLKRLTSGSGEVAAVSRWPYAVFQPEVGHREKVEEISAELEGGPLFLAGSYLGASAMKDAVESGLGAALAVDCSLASTRRNEAVA